MTARRSILPVFFIILFSVLACKHRHHPAEETGAYDLTQIKDSGELVVLTLYSSTTYFIYRGQEMGFQYELSEQFAKSLGVKLRVEVARNVSELIQKLLSGEVIFSSCHLSAAAASCGQSLRTAHDARWSKLMESLILRLG